MSDAPVNATLAIPTEGKAFRLTPVGIEFLGELDRQEWVELGKRLGNAGRSIGLLIGDWLLYGDVKVQEGVYDKDQGGVYFDAIAITGLDYQTLANYANVARKVPRYLRKERLSFEHHRRVAPLKTDDEKRMWLQVAEKEREKNGKTMSARRLAKSIAKGELVGVDEVSVPSSDRGQDNVHPHVNRIVSFWGKLTQNEWLEQSEDLQLERLLMDLEPVVDIHNKISAALNDRRENRR